jgi:predicted metal-dependent hydrolase
MIKYSIRTSSRARRIRLTVTVSHGLVIVVPRYFDVSRIPQIISNKEQWIRNALAKVQQGNNYHRSPLVLPEKIYLRSINSEYSVIVRYHNKRKNILSVDENVITLSLHTGNKNSGFALLKKWIQEKAKEILLPWILRLSDAHGFSFNSAVIRNQRTRWGSCSAKKNINLNRRLIFLPPHLIEYLFLHELCHTKEMNHSKRYWMLVEKHCPNYKSLDKELKHAALKMERWV